MFTFCKPISSKKRFSPLRKLNDDFSFTLFENAKTIIPDEWDQITKGKTIFLEREYLRIIEKCTNSLLKSRYVIVYSNNKPCGVIYFQIVDFRAEIFGDLLTNQVDTIKSTRLKLFESYIGSNKDEVLMRLFTCGNNLMSGEYGFLFAKNIKKELGHELVIQITEVISKEEKLYGAISAVLLKDFTTKLKPAELFESENYTDFFVEPNLIVDIPESVKTLNDYILLFSKKYRNRAKSILKSGDLMEKKIFSSEDIKVYEKEIYSLYETVYNHAKFKLLKLPQDYFSDVKKHFENTFFYLWIFSQ